MTDKAVKLLADGSRAMWRVIWPILKEVSLEEAKELAKDLGKEIGEKITDHIIGTADKAMDALTNLLNHKLKPTDVVLNAPPGPSRVGVDTSVFPVAPSPATPAPAPASATPTTPEVRLDVAPAPTTTTSVASEIRAPDVAPAPTTTPPHVGAPAQVQSTPSALKEATATESSSYMLWYLLGGATVLVVFGGVIYKYNQQRRPRAPERGRGNVEPRETDDEPPTTDGGDDTNKQTTFAEDGVIGTPSKTDDEPPTTDGDDDTNKQTTFAEDGVIGTPSKTDDEPPTTDGDDDTDEQSTFPGKTDEANASKANANEEDTSEATRPGQTVVKPEEAD